MNPKIEKLKAERSRNEEKISQLQSRNKDINDNIVKLENEDIVGLIRATGMTMEELAQFLANFKKGASPFTPVKKEDKPYVSE